VDAKNKKNLLPPNADPAQHFSGILRSFRQNAQGSSMIIVKIEDKADFFIRQRFFS
jgi:hypothetical protein